MNITINWLSVFNISSMLLHVLLFDAWIVRLDKMPDDDPWVNFSAIMLATEAFWIIFLLVFRIL